MPTIAVFDMGSVAASSEPGKATNDRAFDALLDAARAFTLIDRGAPGLCGAPVVGISWTDFIDPELAFAEVGQMSMSARFEGSPSQFGPVKVDEEAIAWAERYLKMQERSALGVALDRLNLARRRHTAIDSRICLEALLGDDSPQELTYKLRLRAALLLGRSIDERQEIRKEVGYMYELRSKMVHSRVRAAKHAANDAKVAARGLEMCSQAVRAIVQRNALPATAGKKSRDGTQMRPDASSRP